MPCEGWDCFSAFDFQTLDINLCLTRQLEVTADEEALENLRHLIADRSPMPWAPINMLDEYNFIGEKLRYPSEISPLKSAA